MVETKTKKRIMFFALFMVVMIFIDQLSKNIVISKLDLYGKKVVIDGFFTINYVRNTGSAFSFLADVSWGIYVLSIISLIMTLVIIYILYNSIKIGDLFSSFALALLSSGAIGNLIDRFSYHYVVDFLRFDFGSYTFPIFNFADMCAVVGTIMLIIVFAFMDKRIDAIYEEITGKKINSHKKSSSNDEVK